MSELGDFVASGLVLLERQTGLQTFTWKLKEVVCTPSTLSRGTTLDIGGLAVEIRLTLHVRKRHFITVDSTLITVDDELITVDDDTPTPVCGRTLVFRGRTMRILRAGEDPARGFYILDLGDPND